jgi:hypothetical protein
VPVSILLGCTGNVVEANLELICCALDQYCDRLELLKLQQMQRTRCAAFFALTDVQGGVVTSSTVPVPYSLWCSLG